MVTWRTLAVLPIKDIISSVFSAECIAQYRRTGRLEPKSMDRVSRATSGLVDQISHFLSSQPTSEYRFAFLLALLIAFIGPLGPGVVTLTESTMTCPRDLPVASMSMDRVVANEDIRRNETQAQISRRAKTFIELELLEGVVYGYDTATEGVLIPWPELGFEQSQNVTIYGSDVVVYNYSCHWEVADVYQPDTDLTAAITIPGAPPNNTQWIVWIQTLDWWVPDEGMLTYSEYFRVDNDLPTQRQYFHWSWSLTGTRFPIVHYLQLFFPAILPSWILEVQELPSLSFQQGPLTWICLSVSCSATPSIKSSGPT